MLKYLFYLKQYFIIILLLIKIFYYKRKNKIRFVNKFSKN